jgi:hypothetical protein
MSKITRIEQRTQAIKSEFSAVSAVNPHTTPLPHKDTSHHPVQWAVWGVGIVLLAGIIAGALWFGVVKGGIMVTSTGLFGIVVICFILIAIMLIFRPK